MGEIQRAMNTLIASVSGGAVALAKGIKKSKGKKPEAKEEPTPGSSLGFTTELSSDEAASRAFQYANENIKSKYTARMYRATRMRDLTQSRAKDKKVGK